MKVSQTDIKYDDIVFRYPDRINLRMNKEMVMEILNGMFDRFVKGEHNPPTRIKMDEIIANCVGMDNNVYYKGINIEIIDPNWMMLSIRMERD